MVVKLDNMKIYVKKIFRFYMFIFFILGLYITYIMGVESAILNENPNNPRAREKLILRGKIMSRSGKILAATVADGKEIKRIYPLGKAAEPLVGYISSRYGKAGLEKRLDKFLKSSPRSRGIVEYVLRYNPPGQDVYLTIDAGIQKEAYRALEGKKGAVVVMNPQNGEILALASSPSFKASWINSRWEKLNADPNSPFLLRPTQGSYPPGSVFKLFTYAACLDEGLVTPDSKFTCNGDLPIRYPLGVYHVREAGGIAHGDLTAEDAVVYSCNVTFARLGMELGASRFVEYARKFGITSYPDFILSSPGKQFPKPSQLGDSLLAQSAFGQGEISLSPLQVAMVTSAFATGGKIYHPRLIKSRVGENDQLKYRIKHRVYKTPIKKYTAEKVRQAMIQVVSRGTGWRARIPKVQVAGKTGSAENPSGDTHAWFTCFAPAENPKFLVTVIIENGGAGGATAAPVARRVLLKALKMKNE